MLNKAERNSTHELLRIVAMFLIVWYHFAYYLLFRIPHDMSLDYSFKPFLPSLHIGVILFLLITGYYGIKPTVHGFLRLLFITMIYYLPVEIVRCLHHNGDMVYTLMFFTHTPYWFIRTYLFFYLLSPIVNKYIATSSQRNINYMLVILAIISLYFGTTEGDPSLIDGTNVVNFSFLYFLGYTIHHYQEHWARVGRTKLLLAFILLNAALIISLYYSSGNVSLYEMIWQLSFPYCAPILIVDAVLLFMYFTLIRIQSKIVNAIASSMFAVYLIHGHPAVYKYVMIPTIDYIIKCYAPASVRMADALMLLLLFGIAALVIMIGSVGIDKCMTPIWKLERKLSSRIQI